MYACFLLLSTSANHPVDPLRVGTLYNADVLQDHHDYRFRHHRNAKVEQMNHIGKDGKLVEPWNENSEFRHGTLGTIVATGHCWLIEQNKRGLPERVRGFIFV